MKRQKQPSGGALIRLERQNVLAVDQDLACGDRISLLAGKYMRERRLAGAVRAHDGMHAAALDNEVEAIEDLLALDLDMQIPHFKQCHQYLSSSPSRSHECSVMAA